MEARTDNSPQTDGRPKGAANRAAKSGPTGSIEVTDDVAAPIRAGMRARAIADACERLALPAVMIDHSGRVLHVAASAEALLADDYTVAAGHLVGQSRAANRRVERAVIAAIGDAARADDDEADDAEVANDLPQGTLRLAGIAVRDPSPFQILKGLLVFVPPGGGASARMDTLRALLAS